MKLTLKQIQAMDFLLQRLNSTYSYTAKDKELNFVVKIDNSLWRGNFVLYQDYRIKNYSIDWDSCIEYNLIKLSDLFALPDSFKNEKFRYIELEHLHLLLIELLEAVKEINTLNFDLDPFMFNAINIETGVKLPFISLEPNGKYDVVSIVESVKDECTHS